VTFESFRTTFPLTLIIFFAIIKLKISGDFMKYYLILDDSGQLHSNYHLDYFVYGGILVKEDDFHGINSSYRNFVKKVKREKKIQGELKTSHMDKSTRRRLLNKLKTYSFEQVFVTVKVSTLVRLNFDSKRDVVRYKNYILKRLVDRLINNGKLPQDCTFVEIHIDNQNIAHSAQDSLQDYLYNIFNENNHYHIHLEQNTTSFNCDFRVFYKDSASNYLVQAADLLANTKCKVIDGETSLRSLFKNPYTVVKLPDHVNY